MSLLLAAGGGGGDVSLALTGEPVAVNAGTLTPAIGQSLAGSLVSVLTGTIVQAISYTPTGQVATASAGTLAASIAHGLTGQSVTGSAGTAVVAITVPLVGSSVTASAGTLTVDSGTSAALNGSEVSALSGTLTPVVTQALGGSAVTASAGTLTPDNGISVSLTGVEVAAQAGSVSAQGGATDTAAPVGGGGPVPRKRKFVHRVWNRLYITEDAEDAERQAEIDEARDEAQRAIAKAKQGKKPIRDNIKVVKIPENGIPLQQIRDMAEKRDQEQQFDQMLKRAQYDRILTLYARMLQEQDDEEVLFLMMV